MSYVTKEVKLNNQAVSVPESQTAMPVSNIFSISGKGSRGIVVEIVVDDLVGTIDFALQDSGGVDENGAASWSTVDSATASADGVLTLKMIDTLAADAAYMPLKPLGRIVATSGGGESCSVVSIRLIQAV